MKWLVTAFAPFDKAQSNSSLILAVALEKMNWNGQIHFHSPVPVTFKGAWLDVQRALTKFPDVDGVLALGQADSRNKISLERVALNWIDARIPDNEGIQPLEREIQSGPEMYWSKIPWQTFTLPAACERSYSAGTFVCNTLMYQICDWAQTSRKLGGFVHIPLLESQSDPQFSAVKRMDDAAALDSLVQVLRFLISL